VTARSRFAVRVDDTTFVVEIEDRPAGGVQVRVDGQSVDVESRLPASGTGSLLLDGASYVVDLGEGRSETHVVVDGEVFHVQIDDEAARRRGLSTDGSRGAGQRLVAPMPGKVVAVLVEVGQSVLPGTPLVVLEAMKMENEFRATASGVVTEVRVTAGQAVDAGALLVVIA
jgi:biotin carboxyl carrier protein